MILEPRDYKFPSATLDSTYLKALSRNYGKQNL